LLLGLPVPGIFLSRERDSQRLLVIDGQQRLKTLEYFYSGLFAPRRKEFMLTGVQEQFEGQTYRSLSDEDRRRLDDSIIHATVVHQDEPSDDDSSIYYIFERINTGGTLLQAQEIRSSIYHGPFVDLLRQLNENRSWRAIYGPKSKNMRDQELILRFLALCYMSEEYSRPMKEFLNRYMGKNRYLKLQNEVEITRRFLSTISVISDSLGSRPFRPQRALNAAVFDSVMVGLSERIDRGEITSKDDVQAAYGSLLQNPEFVDATSSSTAEEEKLQRRLRIAAEAFQDVR